MAWRNTLPALLCLVLLSGSISGMHLHICTHDGEPVAASVQSHSHEQLDPGLHRAAHDGAADLEVDLLAGVLNSAHAPDLPPAPAVQVLLLPAKPPPQFSPASLAGPPHPNGIYRALRPPLRAPPHILPS